MFLLSYLENILDLFDFTHKEIKIEEIKMTYMIFFEKTKNFFLYASRLHIAVL